MLAIAGLVQQSLRLEFAAVFLASTQAALFGPSKYGLLPEVLPNARLSWGNGILELGTFLGVIAGTVIAGVMADRFHGRQAWSGLVFLGRAQRKSAGSARTGSDRAGGRGRNPVGVNGDGSTGKGTKPRGGTDR
jgi:hypothetical protein